MTTKQSKDSSEASGVNEIMKTSKNKKSDDQFLESLLGGPLTLGASLEAIRTTVSLSQSDFAKKLGISRANLCDLEKGRRFVSADKAAEFARRLGHPIATFVRLALQDQIRRAGLKLKIEVKAA